MRCCFTEVHLKPMQSNRILTSEGDMFGRPRRIEDNKPGGRLDDERTLRVETRDVEGRGVLGEGADVFLRGLFKGLFRGLLPPMRRFDEVVD